MGDSKSKIPDMEEIKSITGKIFKSLKSTITEVVHDYKKKREETAAEVESKAEAMKTAEKKEASDSEKKTTSEPEKQDTVAKDTKDGTQENKEDK